MAIVREKKLPHARLIHFADFVLFRGSFFIQCASPFAVSFPFLVTELPQTRAVRIAKNCPRTSPTKMVLSLDDHIFGISNPYTFMIKF